MQSSCHISRFGVIPKGHQPNKWRLIVDLSFPKGHSINDGIPKHLCSLKYISIDDAVQEILAHGRGAILAKIDIKSAFRLIPVHPSDRHLLGMNWNNALYIYLLAIRVAVRSQVVQSISKCFVMGIGTK